MKNKPDRLEDMAKRLGMKVIDLTKDGKEICCHQVMKELGYPVDFGPFDSNRENDPLIKQFNEKIALIKNLKNNLQLMEQINSISERVDNHVIEMTEKKIKELTTEIYEITGKLGWTVKDES